LGGRGRSSNAVPDPFSQTTALPPSPDDGCAQARELYISDVVILYVDKGWDLEKLFS
jgi:hypothetical protein